MLTDDELARFRDHATANPDTRGDTILRLVAEVKQLRAGKQSLVWRLEDLMDRWGDARNQLVREAEGGYEPRLAHALWDCISDLDAAIANRLTDADPEPCTEPIAFGWTQSGYRARQAAREFCGGVDDLPLPPGA